LNTRYLAAQRHLGTAEVSDIATNIASQLTAAGDMLQYHMEEEREPSRPSLFDYMPDAVQNFIDRHWTFPHNREQESALSERSLKAMAATLKQASDQLCESINSRLDIRARYRLALFLLISTLVAVGIIVAVGFSVLAFIEAQHLSSSASSAILDTLRDILVCLGGGAAGAATSVVLRLRQIDRLDPDTTGAGTAVFRVALGVLFALALILLLKSGIVDVLKNPEEGVENTPTDVGFFWAGAGLLAGFNERWVGTLMDRGDKGSSQ
jgi:hypothetical protein